jgi:hypothetical protein
MKPTVKTVASQPSWIVRSKQVELAVTQLGGHLAPVTFCRDSKRPFQPYYVSPWQGEKPKLDTPVLVPLRGDFFCLPFGGNATPYRKEQHTCHGETATAKWQLDGLDRDGDVTTLSLSMQTRIRPGTVTKRLSLVDGHNVVYCQHVLAGFSGKMPLGHHATLAVPDEVGAMRVSLSPIRFAATPPTLFSDPAHGEYQSLAIGAKVRSLSKVPVLWKGAMPADLTAFPARPGFTDLIAAINKPGDGPAWAVAVNRADGYLWFSLKDPAMQPATVMWISNRGRHGPPWDGRNRCLGIEDVCGYFAEGLAESLRPNVLRREGVPTAVSLSKRTPTAVNYIQGAVRIPPGFGRVRTARFGEDNVTFTCNRRCSVTVPVRYGFLESGTPG